MKLHWLLISLFLFIVPGAQATVWNYAQDFPSNPAPQTGNGVDNAWWYFYGDPADRDGAYTLFTQPTGSNGYTNPANAFHLIYGTGSTADADAGLVHPGTFNFSNPASNPNPDVIIGWQAPTTTTINVQGYFEDANGTDSDGPVHQRGILATISSTTTPGVPGGDQDLAQFAAAYLDASNTNEAMRTLLGDPVILPSLASFDFNISVAEDEWLFFRVKDLGSNRFDGTNVSIIINDNVSVPAPGGALFILMGVACLYLRRLRG